MSNTTLKLRGKNEPAVSNDVRLLASLRNALDNSAKIPETVGSAIVMESISEDQMVQIQSAGQQLQAVLESVSNELGFSVDMSKSDAALQASRNHVSMQAAVQGGLMAMNTQSAWSRKYDVPMSAPGRHVVMATESSDYLGRRPSTFAIEAFDNRETRSAVLYTMAYNYTVTRQEEFGETVWPTLTLPADQVGFGIVVNRLTVWRGLQHKVDGVAQDPKKIDLMRAAADHTVLLKNRTRVFPVKRVSNATKFVDNAIVPAVNIDNEGITISTAPLAVGQEIDLLGVSQTDAMLEGGSNNQTDTLDPAVSLETLYLTTATEPDVLKINVLNQFGANFTYAPQGLDKNRNLLMDIKVPLNKDTKNADGSALTDLAVLSTKSLTLHLQLVVSGNMNTEFGTIQVFGNAVRLVKVVDANGVTLADNNTDVIALKTVVAGMKIVGYDVRAWRTNLNMRERGQFIDRTAFTQLYEVPLLSPITAQRPVNTDGTLDAGDFEALVTTTRFRLMNDGVTAILENFESIHQYSSIARQSSDRPEGLGAARFHVIPTAYQQSFDLTDLVDSLTSANRLEDLQAALVNTIRDYGIRMLVESEYQAAAAAQGLVGLPTLVIATDPEIHRYLMITGDLRTMSDKFNFRVVSTLDRRFKGKVFITFGVFDENRNQAPNLLNWGNLVWAPESVLSAQVPRGESMSKETIVQPRYRFVMHCPVATMLTFTGLPEIFKKIPVYFEDV